MCRELGGLSRNISHEIVEFMRTLLEFSGVWFLIYVWLGLPSVNANATFDIQRNVHRDVFL